jgi:hypothetical protein
VGVIAAAGGAGRAGGGAEDDTSERWGGGRRTERRGQGFVWKFGMMRCRVDCCHTNTSTPHGDGMGWDGGQPRRLSCQIHAVVLLAASARRLGKRRRDAAGGVLDD